VSNARRPTAGRGLGQVLVLLLPIALGVIILVACAPEPSPVGAGEECFVASDCAPGLVCVPQRGGSRLCSSDLTQVVGRAPPEAGAEEVPDTGAADGPAEATVPDDTGTVPDTSVPDTSMPDTSVADAAVDG
jgi:hypothetical protein